MTLMPRLVSLSVIAVLIVLLKAIFYQVIAPFFTNIVSGEVRSGPLPTDLQPFYA
jgi:hypothetical protein